MVALDELARIAEAAYSKRDRTDAWRRAKTYGGAGSQLAASLWVDPASGVGVLSVRGTASLREALEDLKLLLGFEPGAWRRGRAVVEDARRSLPSGARLYLTGHSIGGAFASALGVEGGLATVTFNAPGMRDVLERSGSTPPGSAPNVLEVRARHDWISRLSGPQLGRVLDVGPGAPCDPSAVGPVAVVRNLAHARRGRGSLWFSIRRTYRAHSMRVLRRHLAPWAGGRDVEALFGRAQRSEGLSGVSTDASTTQSSPWCTQVSV